MSSRRLSRLAARGLLPTVPGAHESSELKLLARPSLSSSETSLFPLATLASFRSTEPECECPILQGKIKLTFCAGLQLSGSSEENGLKMASKRIFRHSEKMK